MLTPLRPTARPADAAGLPLDGAPHGPTRDVGGADDGLPEAGAGQAISRGRSLGVAAPASKSSPVLADGMLKLMLILLAFFVFLHSRSEFTDRKAAAILDALALRFAATTTDDAFAAAGALALAGDPDQALRRRLLGHLPISAATVEVPGALFAFDLQARELFVQDEAVVLRERLVLLNRLADAIAAVAGGQTVGLTVTTAWPTEHAGLVTGRFAALLRILADRPLAPAPVHLGFADLSVESWRFALWIELPDAE